MISPDNDDESLSNQRVLLIDTVRGIAIFGVVLFHIVWDLEFSGLIDGFAFHPVWLAFGRLLAGTFMFLVGVSLVLAHRKGLKFSRFVRRVTMIGAAAISISLVTWIAFPQTYIFFGILHAIAVSSLFGVLFLNLPALLSLISGTGLLILPQFVKLELFNTRWLAWIGVSSSPPPSNDFVPILPWAGLTLIGIFLAKIIYNKNGDSRSFPDLHNTKLTRILSWMGRNSLLIYLVHQPLLLVIILPVARMLR
jgi:uncharacterized membrane protein